LDDSEHAASNLGEKLLVGVRNLWNEVHRHDKVIDHHGQEIVELRRRLADLERLVHGLRIARGKAKAKNAKLEAALAESTQTISEIKGLLN
jgi:chromosome segregation ATPase